MSSTHCACFDERRLVVLRRWLPKIGRCIESSLVPNISYGGVHRIALRGTGVHHLRSQWRLLAGRGSGDWSCENCFHVSSWAVKIYARANRSKPRTKSIPTYNGWYVVASIMSIWADITRRNRCLSTVPNRGHRAKESVDEPANECESNTAVEEIQRSNQYCLKPPLCDRTEKDGDCLLNDWRNQQVETFNKHFRATLVSWKP